MKKILCLMFLGFTVYAVFAQERAEKCPPGAQAETVTVFQERANAPDFSTTFTDGTQANLYTTLNAGNAVVLDFFFAS